ncbi:chondroitin sulfate glucuronyltransferase [Uranotaenia lowii]|uniref:chondroitin sulfate glucuronyltransferase n=1 Tax=Uranotaenia lowii TaxID=190385 RepID=UPI002479886D|nr:chondroitin sulfate glucuronyltransferase [Uranotaenia lowii]XP_055614161.1 chondroitin sulfate glucuronyltransferase [Uranotaenia lowii]XP_055614162.1 chondroitin sulfate glucuronyltransferase [Uranotaenia lowii]
MWKLCNLSRNQYLLLGMVIGFLYSYYLPQDLTEIVTECPEATAKEHLLGDDVRYGNEFEPQLNLEQKPMQAKKQVKNIVRPRYYYTELGIREKLFVGVMTTQDNIDSLATAINKTSAHLVNKIKFFINADNVKANFKLKNIVGFTDTRENLRPFHVLKYIADNYLDDYDYFLLMMDTGYVNARLLKERLSHVSISFDIYMGTPHGTTLIGDEDVPSDAQYCDLHAGIVLSSSVIRKIRANLDWCVRSAVSNQHNLNIGRCVKYSSKIDSCQTNWQGINVTSYKLHSYKIYRDLHLIKNEDSFNSASVIYPITTADDFYLLHAYFSRIHLEEINRTKNRIQQEASSISNGSLPNDILEVRWPLGVPKPNPPESRHDIIPWTHLNLTHSFMYNTETNVRPLSTVDAQDMSNILNKTIIEAHRSNPHLEYRSLHSAYKKFDAVRGMDYRMHLNFYDRAQRQPVLKSFEVVKPIGLIEIVPSPYVTESTRIAILLPTFEHQIREAMEFVEAYERVSMDNQDNTFLMLIFFYRANTPSKGDEDVFLPLKNQALGLTEKHKQDGSRIAWVSIRLPLELSQPFELNHLYSTSMYGPNQLLGFAAIDLALRKIGLDSLVMVCSVSVTFASDFLNRVRMNTIAGFQVFSPIGFNMYPCGWTGLCKQCEGCDVGQSSGYFDRANYDVISFYSRDYVEARKALEQQLPIVRSDRDIINLVNYTEDQGIRNIADLFVRASGTKIHMLRGIEPNLRFGRVMENFLATDIEGEQLMSLRCEEHDHERCIRIASKKQIGDVLVQYGNNGGGEGEIKK